MSAPSMASPATITITDSTPNPNNDLYDVTFDSHLIKTTVTSDPSIVTSWLSSLTNTTIIGLDVEWRPNFHRHDDHPIATLQLCTSTTCLIFQILHSKPPKALVDFLANENITFCGVGIWSDLERLMVDHDLTVRNAVDLTELAAEKKIGGEGKRLGLKELARVVMGVEIEKPKSVTMSRWDSEWLSYHQVQYACVDAFLSFEIARRLMAIGNS